MPRESSKGPALTKGSGKKLEKEIRWEKVHRLFWDAFVAREEKRGREPEQKVYTALIWREINACLPGVQKVLDAGAGPGRYSLLLAQQGFEVYHLDLSPRMVLRAQKKASRQGLKNIHFQVGSISSLPYPSSFFDLVLALDAPLSYVPSPSQAVGELVRVAKGKIIASAVNRLGQLAVGLGWEAFLRKEFRYSRKFWQTGLWEPPFRLTRLASWPGFRRFFFPPLYAFYPEEFASLFRAQGCRVEKIAAPGTLVRLLGKRKLRCILASPPLYQEFLEIEAAFDAHPEVRGIGAQNASGLLVVAQKV